jgi:hypothetical protein
MIAIREIINSMLNPEEKIVQIQAYVANTKQTENNLIQRNIQPYKQFYQQIDTILKNTTRDDHAKLAILNSLVTAQ